MLADVWVSADLKSEVGPLPSRTLTINNPEPNRVLSPLITHVRNVLARRSVVTVGGALKLGLSTRTGSWNRPRDDVLKALLRLVGVTKCDLLGWLKPHTCQTCRAHRRRLLPILALWFGRGRGGSVLWLSAALGGRGRSASLWARSATTPRLWLVSVVLLTLGRVRSPPR